YVSRSSPINMVFALASTSQSVARSFELFAAFAEERRALTAIEIAERIAAPRSSCAALLKTLTDLGLISLDRRTVSYFPTAKFAELGAWLADGSMFPEPVLETLAALREETAETITLAAYEDLKMELVRVERSAQAISFTAEEGQIFPVWGTGVGTAYLSTLNTQQIRTLYRRAEDRRSVDARAHPLERILADADHAREVGFHAARSAVFPDADAVSAPAPVKLAGRPLVITIAGPASRMRPLETAHGERLRQAVERLELACRA
ncbi:MAG: helix-turn-helix domain-containing protein, partial [Pseudomonadota bacterium]